MARSHYVVPYLAGDPRLPDGVPVGQLFRGVVRPDQSECLVVSASEIGGLTALTEQQIDDTATAWGFDRSVLDAAAVPGETGGAEPFHSENFDGWADADAYHASESFTVFQGDRQSLTAESAPNGATQVLRCSFPDGDGSGSQCNNTTIGFDHDIRPYFGSSTIKELWAEIWIRYDGHWTTAPNASWGCTGNPDHKLFFANVFGTSSRFSINTGNNVTRFSAATPAGADPQLLYVATMNPDVYDGNWHQYHFHCRCSDTQDVGDDSGRFRVWIDGNPLCDRGPVRVPATGIWGISVGRNRNQWADGEMSFYHAGFRLWNEAPSWNTAETHTEPWPSGDWIT